MQISIHVSGCVTCLHIESDARRFLVPTDQENTMSIAPPPPQQSEAQRELLAARQRKQLLNEFYSSALIAALPIVSTDRPRVGELCAYLGIDLEGYTPTVHNPMFFAKAAAALAGELTRQFDDRILEP